MSETAKKGLVEIGRIVLLAVYAAVLGWLLSGGVEWILGFFQLDADIQFQLSALILLILKGVDKSLHEQGKVDSTTRREDWKLKGITRF